MKRSLWLLLAVVALAWYNAGTVWLIQFSCYPLWPNVGRDAFAAYFNFWQQSTSTVVALPLALVAAGSLALLLAAWSELPRWALWTGVVLQAAIEFVRSLWILPLEHDVALLSGQASTCKQLIEANWLFVALVTGYAVLALWMLSRTVSWSTTNAFGRRLLFVISALGFYAVGNMWLVQFVSYPLWRYVAKQQAYAYHIAWWHSIWGVLFIPAGVVLIGSLIMLRVRAEGVSQRSGRAGFAVQLLIYIITAAWFAPLMARLATPEAGLSLPSYRLLMTTHWVRFALFTAYGVVCCYMLVKSTKRPAWRNA